MGKKGLWHPVECHDFFRGYPQLPIFPSCFTLIPSGTPATSTLKYTFWNHLLPPSPSASHPHFLSGLLQHTSNCTHASHHPVSTQQPVMLLAGNYDHIPLLCKRLPVTGRAFVIWALPASPIFLLLPIPLQPLQPYKSSNPPSSVHPAGLPICCLHLEQVPPGVDFTNAVSSEIRPDHPL